MTPTATLTLGPPPTSLEALLDPENAPYTPPSSILGDVNAKVAHEKIERSPHSIAEIVTHLNFGNRRLLQFARGENPPQLKCAADTWPSVEPEDWTVLRSAYLESLQQLRDLAKRPEILEQPVQPDSNRTVGYHITRILVHNAHHLGQVILLRQLMDAWPPKDGGGT
jgi:uncharacterized damage-inducible protein DinB